MSRRPKFRRAREKTQTDPAGIPQFGLVAAQVERVNPDLVARDEQGKPYTVRYEAVNAMLLNEFLKEHPKVEALEGKMAQQQKEFRSVTSQLRSALERAGSANPEGERAARNEQIGTASGRQQSVKLLRRLGQALRINRLIKSSTVTIPRSCFCALMSAARPSRAARNRRITR